MRFVPNEIGGDAESFRVIQKHFLHGKPTLSSRTKQVVESCERIKCN